MIAEDVFFASIREQGALLRSRKLSAVELTEACLDRLERLGPRLGAVVTVTGERALAQAHRANQELLAGHDRGPLHGIPYGAKDLLATRGIPTTWGAEPLRQQVFDHDAAVVERLEQAGAVLVAKLAMVELAGGLGYNNPDASFTGPGRTPWNTDYWSGGSSSGSAAAVAAGLVSFAIGSETSGSILTPSAFCGVTGLRPTYGLVSRHGAMALCWTLDKLGPLARSADDAALVLSAIAGLDPRDPATGESFRYRERPQTGRRFRLGVLQGATLDCDPDVKASFEHATAALREVADLETDVAFPDLPYREAVSLIVDAEGGAALRPLIESGQVRSLQDPADRVGGYAMLATRAADYLDALRSRVAMRAQLDRLLSRFDAVIAPTRTRLAPPIGRDLDAPAAGTPSPLAETEGPPPPATIPAGNLAGLPAIAVPAGFGRDRLPTSLQLLGRAFTEARLVAIADAYQRLTDWHRRRPPL
ncbi:MAG TPA: amidase [Vicinamibacteria bacterium]|nr:amidase [Vicinamibacteria bacterium]